MALSDKKVPDNFHALYDPAARAARGLVATRAAGVQHRGVERLAADVPDVIVHLDEATQMPVSIQTQTSGRRMSGLAASPEDAAHQFVRSRADLWNLSDADSNTLEAVSVSRQGLPTVRLMQRMDGVEVFQGELKTALDAENNVISVTGQAFAGAGSSASRGRSLSGAARLSPAAAIAKAASDLSGIQHFAKDFKVSGRRTKADPYRHFTFKAAKSDKRPGFERPVRLKEVVFPMGEGQFVPGYYIELWMNDYPAFSYVVDSIDTPDILFRKNLSSPATFKYRVHNTGDSVLRPEDGPAPGSPHPTGVPNGFQAKPVKEKLIAVDSLLAARPWLAAGATVTSGNNCIAYADLRAPNGFGGGDVRGKTTANGEFDYTYDHAVDATDPNNIQSSLVGMFFHVNWLHDRWYEAGFDEASGNAQLKNFGLGGLEGDPILAEGADFSGTDNANMSTPADGASPRMQMFTFVGMQPAKPKRTSNHEALITFHEMGHYISNRLVGNASGLSNQQGRAMGEGWGDFFALCMTSQAADDFSKGAFAVGGWTDLTPTFKDNYYFSIRRYPYSADFAKNPLTFQHISSSTVLPVGPAKNPNGGGPNNEVHNAGEVWCSMLWEVFVALVKKLGHQEAERRMLKFVIGGLKQTPNQPTFTQARDGILVAVTALNPGDLAVVKTAFAKRGIGKSAVSPASSSTSLTGVVEDFNP
ncbi:MAG: M36 family metallopeptidase [Vicinamibacterales bacterium]